jgi:PadR family transcriptional regulator, regulatory protein AphA
MSTPIGYTRVGLDEGRGEGPLLTPVGEVVLGMIATFGPMTSYQLEQRIPQTVGAFWQFPHSQLYAEPRKLVADGLLTEQSEPEGRRRRVYTLTDDGELAVRTWLTELEHGRSETRDPGLLKLFFADLLSAGDVRRLAESQARVQRNRERGLMLRKQQPHDEFGSHMLMTLELGIRHARMFAQFWEDLADQEVDDPDFSGHA